MEEEEEAMSVWGWIFLALSWGGVSILCAYCLKKVFGKT